MYSNFKYILKNQWNFDKLSILIQFVRVISGVLVALVAILISKIVLDSLENQLSLESILIRMIPAILIFGILTWLNYASEIGMKRLADCLRYNYYVKELNDTAIRQDYSVYISEEGKNLRQRAEIAVGESGQTGMNSFLTNMTELGKNILGFISYFVILVLLNPIIVVLLIVSYAIDAFVSSLIQKWIHKNKDKRAVIKRKLNYMAYKTRALSVAKDIRMYDMSGWLMLHGNDVIDDADKMYTEIENKRFGRSFIEQVLVFLRSGLAYAYLIYIMLHGDMSIGTFTAYFATIAGFGEWLREIVDLISKITESNYYVKDYRTYADSIEQDKEKIDISQLKHPYTITFEDVCYSYPESNKLILDHVSFEIKSGQKYALVGSNGAGKTTLIKLMCGLLAPTSGRVLLNGIDVRNISNIEYYKLFSAIFQDIGLLPASIAKNIALCVEEKIDEKRVWNCLHTAGLEEKVKSLPNGIHTNLIKNISDDGVDLSKGELQKLLLARAIYKESNIIILDEPTAALDPIAENETYQKYNEIVGNKMSIFISHRLSSTKFCDAIIYLKDAVITEFGSHEELMKIDGEYARIFRLQSQYYNSNSYKEIAECQE